MAMGRNSRERIGMLLLLCSMILSSCGKLEPRPGQVFDEARSAARGLPSFPAADEDYFREMDQNNKGIVVLTLDEVKGRSTWIVWTGGNDRFWDTISVKSRSEEHTSELQSP